MSAIFAGVNLCQTTPEVREWIERHIPLQENRVFHWTEDAPPIFSGLTFYQQYEANIHLRLNVLRWPQGATRWATYHFVATDNQLVDLKAACYGESGSHWNNPDTLILHGCGSEISCRMWMLPPRPLSATPSLWSRANKLWMVTLVDSRYWLNMNHCGDMSSASVATWDDMLDYLRDQAGIDSSKWDCPSVATDWLSPHIDLQNVNSLPLGMMIDAVAWNVGRKVSFDMGTDPTVYVREFDWHKTRADANMADTSFKRMAGGEYDIADRSRVAAVPEIIRVTFTDGEDPRRDDEVVVSTISGYEEENGNGVITFHDHLDWSEVDDTQRQLLINLIAESWLGFQTQATMDISYAGHVEWLPEAMSDAIEWHEMADENQTLIPAPEDGKLRKRIATAHMARTRVCRPFMNQVAEELWHGNGGASGSGETNTITCPGGTVITFTINKTSSGYSVIVE